MWEDARPNQDREREKVKKANKQTKKKRFRMNLSSRHWTASMRVMMRCLHPYTKEICQTIWLSFYQLTRKIVFLCSSLIGEKVFEKEKQKFPITKKTLLQFNFPFSVSSLLALRKTYFGFVIIIAPKFNKLLFSFSFKVLFLYTKLPLKNSAKLFQVKKSKIKQKTGKKEENLLVKLSVCQRLLSA